MSSHLKGAYSAVGLDLCGLPQPVSPFVSCVCEVQMRSTLSNDRVCVGMRLLLLPLGLGSEGEEAGMEDERKFRRGGEGRGWRQHLTYSKVRGGSGTLLLKTAKVLLPTRKQSSVACPAHAYYTSWGRGLFSCPLQREEVRQGKCSDLTGNPVQ